VDLHVRIDGRRDLSGQIYRQIRAAILDGRLRPGEAIPPSRELAVRLEVSRNTVSVAYDRLNAEGFVSGVVGAGTFVSGRIHREPAAVRRPGERSTDGRLRPRPVWDAIPEAPDFTASAEFDFRLGLPDARLFPHETWRRLVARELRTAAIGPGKYAEPAGHGGLRTAIARHIGVSRAVAATQDDVLITNGTQQAIDIIGRVLVEPGDCVAVEEPGYRPTRRVFESLGARVVGVPVDEEGLVVAALPDDARMVYVTPSHQFPLGMSMSMQRRMGLLAWADQRGVVVVEDDYDSEFRYGGRPVEPLQSLDRDGLVVYVGSFSKVMLPILRLGFLVAPASLHRALRVAKYVTDWHTTLPLQAALARFIEDGMLARHIRRMRQEYFLRHSRITAALAGDLADWLEPIPSAAGLHMAAFARTGNADDMREVVRRAGAVGVGLHDLAMIRLAEGRSGLAIGYGAIATERIDEGLRRLRGCLAAVLPGGEGSPRRA
jgi:GntR family transcriptional regulator/MocR family aminotransferase